jgi:hypothetical protein
MSGFRPLRERRSLVAVAVAGAVLIAGFIFVRIAMTEQPPKSIYTQAEAYGPMEEAVAELTEVLPGFPGFAFRGWGEMPCSHNGIDDDRFTNVEVDYTFSRAVSDDPLVRETYVEVLRERWTAQGYEVHRDDRRVGAERVDHSLEARRADGINLWYRVGAVVGITVQSGCVPKSDKSEIDYIPPAGGVEPGGENDGVGRYFPDGIPVESDSPSAIDPFDERGLNPFRD